jgi:HD-GYP domain-containing protein (c-di-GMP phosphodiesterase class II)
VNSNIINKKGKLTDEEMSEMRAHPSQGHKILSDLNPPDRALKDTEKENFSLHFLPELHATCHKSL